MESPARAEHRGRVDIALIWLMRDALLRRSEAAALRWADITSMPDGTGRVTLHRSKTDQEGKGAVLFISHGALQALHKIRQGASPSDSVFGLHSDTISVRIAAACRYAGLHGRFSGHSPRIGMAMDLSAAGASLQDLQQAGRWTSPHMPAHYIRSLRAGRGAVARYYASQGQDVRV